MTNTISLSRRHALLIPLVLAACGGPAEPPMVFQPLRYDYLPPIQLNVATLGVEQRFIPSGVPPDVTAQDPQPPVEALKAMANDRIKPFGTSGRAVFAILDAALTREEDVIIAVMSVSLTVYGADGSQAGFAEARVDHTRSGQVDHLRATLYDITKTMMDQMNVEFEYQVRNHLRDWLTTTTAPDTPVQQAPLDQAPLGQAPPGQAPLGQAPLGQAPVDQIPPGQAPVGQPGDNH